MRIETGSTEFFPVFLTNREPAGSAALASLDGTLDVRAGSEASLGGVVMMQGFRGFRAMFISNGANNDTYHCDIELIERLDYPLNPTDDRVLRPCYAIRKYADITITQGQKTGGATGIVVAADKFADTFGVSLAAYGTYLDAKTGKVIQEYEPTDGFGEISTVDIDNHHAIRFRPHTYGGSVTLVQVLCSLET